MMKVIALDDEQPALTVVEHFCSKLDFVDLQRTFTRPIEAFDYLQEHVADLLFLDIRIPEISGIDFLQSLQGNNVMVIFTTAYSEYALEGFNLQAVDYLLKPFTFNRFKQAIEKAYELYTYRNLSRPIENEYIVVRENYNLVQVPVADIVYVEAFANYLKIYRQDKKPLMVNMTMKALAEKLPADFIRVHRSFIVSLKRISAVRNKTISIAQSQVPVGGIYEEEFYKRFRQ